MPSRSVRVESRSNCGIDRPSSFNSAATALVARRFKRMNRNQIRKGSAVSMGAGAGDGIEGLRLLIEAIVYIETIPSVTPPERGNGCLPRNCIGSLNAGHLAARYVLLLTFHGKDEALG